MLGLYKVVAFLRLDPAATNQSTDEEVVHFAPHFFDDNITLEKSDFFLQRSRGVHVVEHFAGHVPLHEQHVHLQEHIIK